MKKNFGAQPYLFPMPVLIVGTYCEDGTPDAMNAAWGAIGDYKEIALFLSAEHQTSENIKRSKAFTVAVGNEKNVVPCDFVGLVSAKKDKEKLKKSGFSVRKSEFVDAPIIEELPFVLECKLKRIDEESGCIYGEIVNVAADESVLTDGKIDVLKLQPISYDPSSRSYFSTGKKVGTAFSDGAALKR